MEEKNIDMIPEEELTIEDEVVENESVPGAIVFMAGAAVGAVVVTVGKKLFRWASNKVHDRMNGVRTVDRYESVSDRDVEDNSGENN